MAVQGTDGKRYHSFGRARAHNAFGNAGAGSKSDAAPKPNHPQHMQKPTESASKAGAGPADLSHMEIKDVVAKHGPAHKVEMEHDHGSGVHHVTSHHKGGHHKSQHESADAAHMHAAQAAGVETPDTEDEGAEAMAGTESPEEEAAEESAIPGVR